MLPKQLPQLFCFLSAALYSSAQHIKKETTQPVTAINKETMGNLPFARGMNEIIAAVPYVDFSNSKSENSDNTNRNIDVNLEWNHFFGNGFGAGIQLDLSSQKNETGVGTFKTNDWMAYVNAIYGHSFDNFNLYLKGSVGIGKGKDVGNTFSNESDLFGYKVEVGSPVHLFNGGGNYFTPFIDYRYVREKDNSGTTANHTFGLGFRLENYSSCSSYQCDCHHGRGFSKNIYDRGRNFIGYSTMGHFNFGNSTYTFNNSKSKTDVSDGLLELQYGHYIIPDLAIGAGFSWNTQTNKSGSSKSSHTELLFTPLITANLPIKNCWNNLFVQGGYGFGSEKFSSGSFDQKNNQSQVCVNLGYNFLVTDHLSVTPMAGYDWDKSKNTTTDATTKSSGPDIKLGAALWF